MFVFSHRTFQFLFLRKYNDRITARTILINGMEPKIFNSYRILISEGKQFSKIVNRIVLDDTEGETSGRLEVITRIIDRHRHVEVKKETVSGQVNEVGTP